METSEDRLQHHTISTFHLMAGQASRDGVGIRIWNAGSQARMRPPAIVMTYPLGQDSPEVPLTERNAPIQTLTTRCPDHAFAIGVRLRHRNRCLQYANPHDAQGAVHRVREDGIVIVHDESM